MKAGSEEKSGHGWYIHVLVLLPWQPPDLFLSSWVLFIGCITVTLICLWWHWLMLLRSGSQVWRNDHEHKTHSSQLDLGNLLYFHQVLSTLCSFWHLDISYISNAKVIDGTELSKTGTWFVFLISFSDIN